MARPFNAIIPNYQRENEAQPPVRDRIPHSHNQEWNKVFLSKQYPNTKPIQQNSKPLPIPVNNRYANSGEASGHAGHAVHD